MLKVGVDCATTVIDDSCTEVAAKVPGGDARTILFDYELGIECSVEATEKRGTIVDETAANA